MPCDTPEKIFCVLWQIQNKQRELRVQWQPRLGLETFPVLGEVQPAFPKHCRNSRATASLPLTGGGTCRMCPRTLPRRISDRWGVGSEMSVTAGLHPPHNTDPLPMDPAPSSCGLGLFEVTTTTSQAWSFPESLGYWIHPRLGEQCHPSVNKVEELSSSTPQRCEPQGGAAFTHCQLKELKLIVTNYGIYL